MGLFEGRLVLNGREFSVNEKLISSGVREQISFCLKLALAWHIYKNTAGFIIFDEPFIYSDRARRLKMINLLKEFVDNGWQIFIFTAHDHIKEDFKDIFPNDIYIKDLSSPPK